MFSTAKFLTSLPAYLVNTHLDSYTQSAEKRNSLKGLLYLEIIFFFFANDRRQFFYIIFLSAATVYAVRTFATSKSRRSSTRASVAVVSLIQ